MKYVFDTETILIFYLGEDGAKKVLDLLINVQNKKVKGYINIINLTEFYYILYRKNPEIAKQKVENLLSFGLVPSEIKDDDLWREAGKLKALHNIPLADAFAAATANHLKATLIAGKDTDFEGLDLDIMRV
ncbi:MAG: PIN domain-containing protein [Candidatus Methanoperedens sp.]|nr:PIN domain-containing protein [Candidatus Methanoperedens sp.]MCE8424605.1 PIN domain-containing protein [Candidatus Methanoperedens sp.]MCE8428259.1 PIN domain-containing protein [Candidatus Methanoperedens sp.]